MENFRVVVWGSCDTFVKSARKLTEVEKEEYTDDMKDSILVGVGDYIELSNLSNSDLFSVISRDDYAGVMPGYSNICYYLTPEKEEKLLKLDKEKAREKEEKKQREEIEKLTRLVKRVEEGSIIVMPRREIASYIKNYNNLYNEGGEGYLPDIVATESYEEAKKKLREEENK